MGVIPTASAIQFTNKLKSSLTSTSGTSSKILPTATRNCSIDVRPSNAKQMSSKLLSVITCPFISAVISDSNAATNAGN